MAITPEAKAERARILAYIDARIEERVAWANSEDGRRRLGPGSPTIPGLEDMQFIRHFVARGGDYFEDTR